MTGSIDDWFQDHSDGSLGDHLDDEVLERSAPWDLHVSGMSTTRSERRQAGAGAWRGARGRGGRAFAETKRAVNPVSSGRGKTTGDKKAAQRKPATPRAAAADLDATIRRVAKANPGVGYKRIARHLRDQGINVSRAQVAHVLAHPNSWWKRKATPVPAPRKPSSVVRISAGAQRSRTVPVTDLCPSCGVRLSVIATCRCS